MEERLREALESRQNLTDEASAALGLSVGGDSSPTPSSTRGGSEAREELAMLQARLESHQAEIEELGEEARRWGNLSNSCKVNVFPMFQIEKIILSRLRSEKVEADGALRSAREAAAAAEEELKSAREEAR